MSETAHAAGLSPAALASLLAPAAEDTLEDPAELYHEASKGYASFSAREMRGARLLEASPELRRTIERAVKRHPHRRAVFLPPPTPLRLELGRALADRRSRRSFSDQPLSLGDVGTLLAAACGISSRGKPRFRTTPSGGALYPLDVYLIAARVEGTTAGLYHYDPTRAAIEELRLADLREELREAMVYPELADAGAFVVVTAMFLRSRFKYGLRGYRFALIEAGHLVQNLLLAATALDLAAVPVGGFYDRRLERLVGVDGVNESAVYAAAVGRGGGEP